MRAKNYVFVLNGNKNNFNKKKYTIKIILYSILMNYDTINE